MKKIKPIYRNKTSPAAAPDIEPVSQDDMMAFMTALEVIASKSGMYQFAIPAWQFELSRLNSAANRLLGMMVAASQAASQAATREKEGGN